MSIAEAVRDSGPASRRLRMKKVLIVEPVVDTGRAINLALEEAGFYPNAVSRVEEARRRVFERHYDLIVLSTTLDKAARESVVREMLKHGNVPQVLMLAGMDEELDPKELESVPSLSVLRHPVTGDDVVDATVALLGSPWPDDK